MLKILRLMLILLITLPSFALAAGQTDYVLTSDPRSERAHQFQGSGSRLQKCGGMVGLRNEFYTCRTTPAIIAEPKNLSLNLSQMGYPKPSASSTSAGYESWGPMDGKDSTWTNESTDPGPSTWDIDFGKPTHVGKVFVKTWGSYALKDFDLLCWDGQRADWDIDHPVAKIRGNTKDLITIPHLDLTTQKLRMLCINGPDHQPMYRRIEEFIVFAPSAPTPKFKPNEINYRMAIPTSGKWTLEVQEVNDDHRNGDRTRYRVLVDGKSVFLRDFADEGPGLATYFIDIPATGKPFARITLRDTSGFGMRIRSLRAYSDFMRYCRDRDSYRTCCRQFADIGLPARSFHFHLID